MFPLLIENDLFGIAFLSLAMDVALRSLLGRFAMVLQTLVYEVVCQRKRVLIVRVVFMEVVEMLRLHVIFNLLYKIL